jgi:hypothetical protein
VADKRTIDARSDANEATYRIEAVNARCDRTAQLRDVNGIDGFWPGEAFHLINEALDEFGNRI